MTLSKVSFIAGVLFCILAFFLFSKGGGRWIEELGKKESPFSYKASMKLPRPHRETFVLEEKWKKEVGAEGISAVVAEHSQRGLHSGKSRTFAEALDWRKAQEKEYLELFTDFLELSPFQQKVLKSELREQRRLLEERVGDPRRRFEHEEFQYQVASASDIRHLVDPLAWVPDLPALYPEGLTEKQQARVEFLKPEVLNFYPSQKMPREDLEVSPVPGAYFLGITKEQYDHFESRMGEEGEMSSADLALAYESLTEYQIRLSLLLSPRVFEELAAEFLDRELYDSLAD